MMASFLGYINQLVLARVYGVGLQMDGLILATSAPNFVCGLISSFFLYSTVPLLRRSDDPDRTATAVFLLALVLCIPFLLISIYYALGETISPRVTNGKATDMANLYSLAWLFGITQVIFGSFYAVLNSRFVFVLPLILVSLVPLFSIFATLWTHAQPDARGTIIGMLIGGVGSVALAANALRGPLGKAGRVGVEDFITLLRGNSGFWGTLMASNAFSWWIVIDAFLAPSHGEGALSSLAFTQRLIIGFGNMAVVAIFLKSGPIFSDVLKRGGIKAFRSVVLRSLATVSVAATFLAYTLWIFSDLILAYTYGVDLSLDQIALFESFFPYMLSGMVPMLASAVALRALFCLPNTHNIAWLFGCGVPLLYAGVCIQLHDMGLYSFGIAYLASWSFGFLAIAVALFIFKYQSETVE